MKKKHRDIIVDGVKYGWIAQNDYNKTLKIFKTKNDFVKFEIPDYLDITPNMVAALIKDPVLAMMWINAEHCPFCGKPVEPVEHNDFFKCEHEEDCWIHLAGKPISIISQAQLKTWNKRHS